MGPKIREVRRHVTRSGRKAGDRSPAAIGSKRREGGCGERTTDVFVRPAALGVSGSPEFDSYGLYERDLERCPLIKDPQVEREIGRKARTGDRHAAERLVTANLRFVISYVKRYRGRGLQLAELVSIGNFGLLMAARKFDPDKGVKFISYAVWYIRHAVLQALTEQTRPVRIPLHVNRKHFRLARAEKTLANECGRSPSDFELADTLEESVRAVRALRHGWTELSLDAPLDESNRDSASFGERLVDDAEIEKDVEDRICREFLDKMFERYLDERERKILILYYGLSAAERSTLRELGSRFGVTAVRIAQIRDRALGKLRASHDRETLESFWRA